MEDNSAFKTDDRMSFSGQKWAKGWEPNPPTNPQQSLFEKKVSELGLKPEEYVSSKKLRQWVTSSISKNVDGYVVTGPIYNVCFIPEALLREWEIKTDWDEIISENGMIPFSQMSILGDEDVQA